MPEITYPNPDIAELTQKKSVLLADDHGIIRDAIKYYIEEDDEYCVTAEASNGIEALELLMNNSYDLLITDISMPEMNGVELIEKVKELNPEQKSLILSMYGDSNIVKEMLGKGADGFVMKNASKSELNEAIDRILNGENFFSKEIFNSLLDNLTNKKGSTKSSFKVALSAREKEILDLIVKEYTNLEIADKLFISVRTVETHKRNLIEKTRSRNVAGLVKYAMKTRIMG
ncbi:MAG: response regulator [Bacteroidota bacterium]